MQRRTGADRLARLCLDSCGAQRSDFNCQMPVAGRNGEVEHGADYVIFGPVWESASHPGIAPAGLAALADVLGSVGIPVLAIGGVTRERALEVLASGAAGYAAIGLFE